MAIDGIGGGMNVPPPPKSRGGAPAGEPIADKDGPDAGAAGARFADITGLDAPAPTTETSEFSGGDERSSFEQDLESALEEASSGGPDGKGGQIDVMA